MADFSLATGRAQVSGGSGGLNSSKIQATRAFDARSAQINPGVAQLGFTPSSIPPIVHDNTVESAVALVDSTSKAAFAFSERQAEYQAQQAVAKFNQEAADSYNGREDENGNFIGGYGSTTMFEADGGYSAYSAGLEELFNDSVANLEPRVRQRALLGMFSTKTSILGKAAVHRSSEIQKIKDGEQFMKRETIIAGIASFPESINEGDIDGITPKAKFFATFGTDVAKAKKAWAKLIQNVGENIYLKEARKPNAISNGSASGAANAFFVNHAEAELQGSQSNLSVLQGNVLRWQAEALRADNSTYQKLQTQIAKETKARRENFEFNLQSEIAQGYIPTADDIANWNFNSAANPAYLKGLQERYIDKREAVVDPLAFSAAENKILSGEPYEQNFWLYDQELRHNQTVVSKLETLAKNMSNPDFDNRMNRVNDLIGVYTDHDLFGSVFGGGAQAELARRAREVAYGMIENNPAITVKEVNLALHYRFNPRIKALAETKPIPGLVKIPKTVDEFKHARQVYETMVETEQFKNESEQLEMQRKLKRIKKLIDQRDLDLENIQNGT